MANADEKSLDLTDENQRLVNLKLLRLIYEYKLGGITGLYERLSLSRHIGIKAGLSKEGMRKAIHRDLQNLENLAGKPDNLRKWLKKRKNSQRLQIRIAPNQFLLNDILSLLGVSFESLFDKNHLLGIADESIFDTDLNDEQEINNENKELLLQINAKLDIILQRQSGERNYRTLRKRFFDLIEYIFIFREILSRIYNTPQETGFSFTKNKNTSEPKKHLTNEIYGRNYIFIIYFMGKIHKKHRIHKLFDNMERLKNNDFWFGRLLSSFFMAAILLHLMKYFVYAGIRNKKNIFKILEGDVFDFFRIPDYDNKKIFEKLKLPYSKTINIIRHIQDFEIRIEEGFCVECEKFLVNFFINTDSLFSTPDLTFSIKEGFFNNFNTRNDMNKKLNDLFSLRKILIFAIRSDQLDYLDKYHEDIEEIQIKLENYYIGNDVEDNYNKVGRPIVGK
jgi:hypothetical protein